MSEENEAPDAVDESAEDDAPKKGGRLKSIVMIVLGLGLGTGAGMFFVGPKFFGGPAEASAESTEDGEASADDGHGAPSADAEVEDEGPGTMHTIANLIVNPAGSNGNRFLLVDLALGLTTTDAVTELETRDAAVRDELLLLLGSKTVRELADVTARSGLKEEIKTIVAELLTTGAPIEVFFPRFVIQ